MCRKFFTSKSGVLEQSKYLKNSDQFPSLNKPPKFILSLWLTLFALCFLKPCAHAQQISYGGVKLGNLPNYFMAFTDGNVEATWQGKSSGFIGDVAINGLIANKKTDGTIPYAGTITTNDQNLDGWQNIIDENKGQASIIYGEKSLIYELASDLENVFSQINALRATKGFYGVSASSLNKLNTQNDKKDILVINITSDFKISDPIYITGDADDIFFFRWDTDTIFSNGYQGQVSFQGGGAFVPLGGLKPTNFIHIAGDINGGEGGSNPSSPFPQGPRTSDGSGDLIKGASDFNGGGFFTGYWFTTGEPSVYPKNGNQPYGNTSSLSNCIFVGGWYSKTDKFNMSDGTGGVYIGVPTALPVSWLNVSAKYANNNSVLISWSTAQEMNNDYFTVEKSVDGERFEVLGYVQGGGNRSSISNYCFEDKNNSVALTYYRIKQSDFNGDYDYSKVVFVIQTSVVNNFQLRPNPAGNYAIVEWKSKIPDDLNLLISDMTGRVLLQQNIRQGNNSASIQLTDLPTGIYWLDVITDLGTNVYRTKLVISK